MDVWRPLFCLALAGYDGCTILLVSHWPWNYLETLHFSAQHPSQDSSLPKLQPWKSGFMAVLVGLHSLYALFVLLALSVSILGQRDWMWGSVLHAWLQTLKSIPSLSKFNLSFTLVLLLIRHRGSRCKSATLCLLFELLQGRPVQLKFYENLLVLRPCSLLENFLPYGRKPWSWSCRVL